MENKSKSRVIKFLDRRVDLHFYSTFQKLLRLTFGLNDSSIKQLSAFFGITPLTLPSVISSTVFRQLELFIINNFVTGRSLKKKYITFVNEKKKINSYAGVRHSQKLPVRGQRTHSNSKSVRRTTYFL